jgi:hypothetical protein
VDAIVERLELLAADEELRIEMSDRAAERASQFTLGGYARRLFAALPGTAAAPTRMPGMPHSIPIVA